MLRVEETSGLILDLGGGPASFFAAMFPRPKRVILVDVAYDLAHKAKRKQSALNVIVADGERLPLADCCVDITVCNSVIEHVGSTGALAKEIDRVSQGYFVQTPNGGFPLETHSFIAVPFYNLIPWAWLRRFICGIFGANFDYVNSVRYLSEQELRNLFPGATIAHEKMFGLKKSFYVYFLIEKIR